MLTTFLEKLTLIWQKLSLVQRWYFSATAMFGLWLLTFTRAEIIYQVFGMMLLIAASIDIWQSAVRIWHSLPGKVMILASYAILANFCYAFAESQMNAISGIKPELTPFSVNLMIVLQAPFWTFLLTVFMGMLYLSIHTLKIMLLMLVRPVSKVHAQMLHEENYPFISLLMRIVYLPVVLVFVSIAIKGYLDGDTSGQLAVDERAVSMLEASAETSTVHEIHLGNGYFKVPNMPWANKLVAHFLYQVESQGKSHCKITDPEHAVQINDYEILVISPDNSQDLGYRFTVRGCHSANLPKILQLETPSH